jgi:hypothetical protein
MMRDPLRHAPGVHEHQSGPVLFNEFGQADVTLSSHTSWDMTASRGDLGSSNARSNFRSMTFIDDVALGIS